MRMGLPRPVSLALALAAGTVLQVEGAERVGALGWSLIDCCGLSCPCCTAAPLPVKERGSMRCIHTPFQYAAPRRCTWRCRARTRRRLSRRRARWTPRAPRSRPARRWAACRPSSASSSRPSTGAAPSSRRASPPRPYAARRPWFPNRHGVLRECSPLPLRARLLQAPGRAGTEGEGGGDAAQVRAVQEYVRELLDQEQKFLVFAHHQVLMDGIQEVLNKRAPAFRPMSFFFSSSTSQLSCPPSQPPLADLVQAFFRHSTPRSAACLSRFCASPKP